MTTNRHSALRESVERRRGVDPETVRLHAAGDHTGCTPAWCLATRQADVTPRQDVADPGER